MSTRWLLVLGSDEDGGAPIGAALQALAAAGTVRALAGPRRSRDDAGADRWFTNCLVQLDSTMPRAALAAEMQRIERGIGRAEGSDAVPIDIDPLACDPDGGGWRLDTHAAHKAEHRRAHVVALLREAGISLPAGS